MGLGRSQAENGVFQVCKVGLFRVSLFVHEPREEGLGIVRGLSFSVARDDKSHEVFFFELFLLMLLTTTTTTTIVVCLFKLFERK